MATNERFSIDAVLDRVRAARKTEAPAEPLPGGPLPRRVLSHASVPLVPLPADVRLDPTRDSYTVGDFLALSQEAFVEEAYRYVLGREADAAGRAHYLRKLQLGQTTPVSILMGMRFSPEGKAHGASIKRLIPSYALYRTATLPVFGRFFAPLVAVLNLPGTLARLHTRLAVAEAHHKQALESINQALLSVRRSLVELGVSAEANQRQAGTNANEIERVGTSTLDEMRAMREQSVAQSLIIGDLVRTAQQALNNGREISREATSDLHRLDRHRLDDLYVAFENRFRGSRDEIAAKLTRYLPLFQHNDAVAAGGTVLDIGCGRGEWLKILGSHNIRARGIDLNQAMVGVCNEQGLEAQAGDAVAYMRSLSAGSLAAVTGFHIIEHLRFEDLVEMLDAARHVLSPGGLILFETPNPENVVVGACTFNNDPTHNKPLPPEVLRFLAEARGFENTRIIRDMTDIDLAQPESGFEPSEINDWFRLPMDYALYAQKRPVS